MWFLPLGRWHQCTSKVFFPLPRGLKAFSIVVGGVTIKLEVITHTPHLLWQLLWIQTQPPGFSAPAAWILTDHLFISPERGRAHRQHRLTSHPCCNQAHFNSKPFTPTSPVCRRHSVHVWTRFWFLPTPHALTRRLSLSILTCTEKSPSRILQEQHGWIMVISDAPSMCTKGGWMGRRWST